MCAVDVTHSVGTGTWAVCIRLCALENVVRMPRVAVLHHVTRSSFSLDRSLYVI